MHEIIFHHFQSSGLFCRKMFIPSLEVAQFFYDFSIVNVRVKMMIIKNRREAARKINELYDEEKKILDGARDELEITWKQFLSPSTQLKRCKQLDIFGLSC